MSNKYYLIIDGLDNQEIAVITNGTEQEIINQIALALKEHYSLKKITNITDCELLYSNYDTLKEIPLGMRGINAIDEDEDQITIDIFILPIALYGVKDCIQD